MINYAEQSEVLRAQVAQKENVPTIIVLASPEDNADNKEIMRLRHTIKTCQKLEKELLKRLYDRHAEGRKNVNIVLRTRRRVLAWYTWVKQTVKWREEEVIPAGWVLGKCAHHRYNPRDSKAMSSNDAIAKEIERIESTINQ
jgi:hypothetical protein